MDSPQSWDGPFLSECQRAPDALFTCYTVLMAEKPDNAEPRRRRYQFGLRTLLIGVALLSVVCAVGSYVTGEARIVADRKAWSEAHPPWLGSKTGTGTPIECAKRNESADPSQLRRWLGDSAIDLIEVFSDDNASAAIKLFPEAQVIEWR